MDWTDEVIVELRTLWAEGHSTAVIGRKLGCSKNSLVGKVHRLDLPSRPSPIRYADGRIPVLKPRPAIPPPPLPTLPSLSVPLATFGPPSPPIMGRTIPPITWRIEAKPPVAPAPAPPRPVLKPLQPAPVRAEGRVSECAWPLGMPGKSGFKFCCDESEPGKPYCGVHAKLAYIRVRDREDA